MESQLNSEKTRRMSDAEEWRQFQADLLMTVRVANDFQVRLLKIAWPLSVSNTCIHITLYNVHAYFKNHTYYLSCQL